MIEWMIDWAAVTAGCAVLTILGIAHSFVVIAIVRSEIRKLNGTYLRSDLAKAEFQRINEHFSWLQKQTIPGDQS